MKAPPNLTVDLWREFLSEFVGTYLLVLLGAASVIVAPRAFGNANPWASTLFVASAFGGTASFVILALGRRSHALINPAVTVAHVVARSLGPSRALPYLAFQLLGGLVAGVTLRALFQSADVTGNLGSTSLAAGVPPIAGTLLELTGTAVLASATLVASRWPRGSGRRAVGVGGTLALLIVFLGPLTGASLNPARSFGPSLASGYWEDQYAYWIGPALGGMIAGVVFRMTTSKRTGPVLFVCVENAGRSHWLHEAEKQLHLADWPASLTASRRAVEAMKPYFEKYINPVHTQQRGPAAAMKAQSAARKAGSRAKTRVMKQAAARHRRRGA